MTDDVITVDEEKERVTVDVLSKKLAELMAQNDQLKKALQLLAAASSDADRTLSNARREANTIVTVWT